MRLVVNWFAQCSCIHPVFLYSPRLSSIVLPFFHLQRFCSAWVSVSMVQSLLLISHMVQLLTRHLHHIYVTWWKVAKWLPSLGRRWGPTLWVILPRLPNTWGLTNTWGDEGKKKLGVGESCSTRISWHAIFMKRHLGEGRRAFLLRLRPTSWNFATWQNISLSVEGPL